MKKALIVTTVSGFLPQFEMNNVKILQSMGYEIHYAANYTMPVYGENNSRLDNTGIIRHQIDFVRSPFQLKNNHKAYLQLKALMRTYSYDLVHCHTPMGGVLTRLAAKTTKTAPVLYTAHGFHFYKGASLKNWIFFYPVERYLAKYTDVLITINKEDYEIARKFKLRKQGSVKYIKGIGINTKNDNKRLNSNRAELKNQNRNKQDNKQNDKSQTYRTNKCQELGVDPDTFLLISVGELTKRKNHIVILEALAKLNNPRFTYIICGTGVLELELKKIAKDLKVEGQVVFAGYRTDIKEILQVADCFLFPSIQEGLPVALLEAMSVGLPVVCSRIRGNTDLIRERRGGYLVGASDIDGFSLAIEEVFRDSKKMREMGNYNLKVIKEFDIKKISCAMEKIYKSMEQLLLDGKSEVMTNQ